MKLYARIDYSARRPPQGHGRGAEAYQFFSALPVFESLRALPATALRWESLSH